MTKYESKKLLQFVDAVTAEKELPREMREETADIIGRMRMFSGHPELTVASVPLVKLAQAYGLQDIPHPAFSLQILQEILCMEQRRAQDRRRQ